MNDEEAQTLARAASKIEQLEAALEKVEAERDHEHGCVERWSLRAERFERERDAAIARADGHSAAGAALLVRLEKTEQERDAALASNAALRSALEKLFAMIKAAQDQEVCRNLVIFAGEMVDAALRETAGAELLDRLRVAEARSKRQAAQEAFEANFIDGPDLCVECHALPCVCPEEETPEVESVFAPLGVDAVLAIVSDHYLAGIECDHERKRDRASCACSLVALPWCPNVGTAVESWISHVRDACAGRAPTLESEAARRAVTKVEETLKPARRRGVDEPCEGCGKKKGSSLDDGWYRCNACGYPGK